MKRIIIALALTMMTTGAASAGVGDFSLPRLEFPTTGGDVTQACNPLTQACAQD
jgi:hypothetical protein